MHQKGDCPWGVFYNSIVSAITTPPLLLSPRIIPVKFISNSLFTDK